MDNERKTGKMLRRVWRGLIQPWFALSKRRLVVKITGGGEKPPETRDSR